MNLKQNNESEITRDISLMKNSFENRAYKKHFHNTYSISLITDGECVFCKNQSKYKAKKGDVRVINPYEVHEIYSSSWEHINLVLSAYFVRCVAKNFKDINIGFKTIINDEKLMLDIQNLYDKNSKKTEEILRYMLENYSKVSDKEPLHVEKLKLQKAVLYIYQNANNESIELDEIISHVGLSKYHFLREFKKEFGLTPHRYVQNIKINNARRMLHYDLPLSQIAQECGFYDQSHFIKTYKKFFGHTPSKSGF